MLFPILLSCVCVLVVTLYLQYRWRHRRVLEAASKLPCPPTLPLIGNAHLLVGNKSEITKKFMSWSNQYNGLYCVWIGPVPMIIVSNPADMKIITGNSGMLEKSFMYDYLRPYLGEGLVTGHVPIWKKHRRIMNALFHPSNIERVFGQFCETGRDITAALDRLDTKHPINPKDIIFENILLSSIEVGIGRGIMKYDEDLFASIKYLTEWALHVPMIRLLNPLYYSDTLFNMAHWKKVKKASACKSLIESTILESFQKFKTSKDNSQSKGWVSLIDIWYEDTSGTSDDPYWMDEFLTLSGAATDTTTCVVYFLLASLAANEDVQDRVYAEIKEVVGSREGDLNLSDLNSLTYLGHVITESMRLHGVVPFIGRVATKDTKLTNVTLPAGANVFIHLHAMGWDPNVFPEPHRFNPDRFLTANDQETSAISKNLLPFSAGPRNCIGKNYAYLQMKCIIVEVLRKFKLVTTLKLEDIEYELSFVSNPENPLIIEFHERK